jgi:hypothetical protein
VDNFLPLEPVLPWGSRFVDRPGIKRQSYAGFCEVKPIKRPPASFVAAIISQQDG